MLKSFDFKALSIGLLIYVISTIVFGYILIAVFTDGLFDLLPNNEWKFEFLISILATFAAGYYTFKLARRGIPNQSLLLGIIISAYHLIGTINQLQDTYSDQLLINLTYDASIILFTYLGGRLARRSLSRKAATNNITG